MEGRRGAGLQATRLRNSRAGTGPGRPRQPRRRPAADRLLIVVNLVAVVLRIDACARRALCAPGSTPSNASRSSSSPSNTACACGSRSSIRPIAHRRRAGRAGATPTSAAGIVDLLAGPAVLVRVRAAGRFAGPARVPRDPLPQARALFARRCARCSTRSIAERRALFGCLVILIGATLLSPRR